MYLLIVHFLKYLNKTTKACQTEECFILQQAISDKMITQSGYQNIELRS